MDLSSALRTTKSVITANSPVLLVGTAIAGVVTTGVLAAMGGYKARGLVDAERMRRTASPEPPFDTFLDYYEEFEKKAPNLTSQEKFKLTWLCYAAPTLTAASTIASVAGVHTIHTKRHAALAGLYAVTSTKLDDYREKAEELLGTKKTQQLNNALGQQAVDRDPLHEDREVYVLAEGTELFYDDWSGRYFMSSMAAVEKAHGKFSTKLALEGDASLNEFYDLLGLPPNTSGKDFGWSGDKVNIEYSAVTAKDGRSAIAIWFQPEPKENLGIKR